MLSAIASEIKDFSLSPDGNEAKFVLVTKYAGDIEVTVPSACLDALKTKSAPSRPSVRPTTAVETANGRSATGVSPTPGIPTNPKSSSVTVSVPKTWLVAADAQRGMVIVVLNHQLDGQFSFALQAKSAEEVAVAIKKQVDTLAAPKPAT